MKWKNIGHEFDEVGDKFKEINEIYIWGSGNNGEKIAKDLLRFNINIKFLDMNENIKSKLINGIEFDVVSLNANLNGVEKGKLLLVALKEGSQEQALLKAYSVGWSLDVNLFDANIFMKNYFSIFLLYNKNFLYFGMKDVIALSFNEICTLKCENCNASIPYIRPHKYHFNEVIEDSKRLFDKIDFIEILRIGGAETFLYNDIDKIISFINENYSHKYGCMELTTNGTVEIDNNLLELLNKCRVRVCISDYSEIFPNFKDKHSKLISCLKQSNVMYSFLEDMYWVDFGFNNKNIKAKGDYTLWHDCCAHPCKDFRNGKLYSCSQAYWAQRRYEEFAIENDYLEITKDMSKKEIFEYIKGYNINGYLMHCIICNGHSNINSNYVRVAEQL
ncbi:MAG: radical SAM protein [Lachnospirales bacterium]